MILLDEMRRSSQKWTSEASFLTLDIGEQRWR